MDAKSGVFEESRAGSCPSSAIRGATSGRKALRAIGLDLGGTFIKAGTVASDGTVLRKGQFPTRAGEGRDAVIREMCSAIDSMMEGIPRKGIAGIGIGTPGLVDREGNVFEAPNLPGWDNIPLRNIFRRHYRLPVTVENDVNSITWGEYLFGAGKGCGTLVCVTMGTGLGGGVILNGRLVRGGTFSAAEVGHLTIDYQGPPCNCGSIGCVERFVSRDAIVERATRAIAAGRRSAILDLANGRAEDVTPRIISEAFHKGDSLAREIWTDVGICLGASLAGLVNLFNPDRIVIGGGIAQVGDILFRTVRDTIRERAMRRLSENLEVLPAGLGTDAGIVSGAALVFQT